MSPALLTSFRHSAFPFYILIATAMTNYGKKSLPVVSILVHWVSPSKPGEVGCSQLEHCSILETSFLAQTVHSSHHRPTQAGGKEQMECNSEERQDGWKSVSLLLGSRQARKQGE